MPQRFSFTLNHALELPLFWRLLQSWMSLGTPLQLSLCLTKVISDLGSSPGIKGFFLGNINNFLQCSAKLSCSGGNLGRFLNLLQAPLGPAINEGETCYEKELVADQIHLGGNSLRFFLEEAILLS